VKKILFKTINNKIFKKKPIVLMHIGSQGSEFLSWSKIGKVSILISVDASNTNKSDRHFLKKINIKSIISEKNSKRVFNTTKDSDCSSLLIPNKTEYSRWFNANRFKVINKKKVDTISLNKLLKKLNIDYIDWLVIDAQGIDLKIFKSLKTKIRSSISILEIEPGFFKFYKNEGNISEIFNFMNKKFEFSDMKFGHSYKLDKKILKNLDKKILYKFNNPSIIYSNITFINKLNSNLRIRLLKILYLILSRKYFEAKNYLLQNNISKEENDIILEIDKKITFFKILYFFGIPLFIFKKIYRYIKELFI